VWSYKLELNGEVFNDWKTKSEVVPIKMHFTESQFMRVIQGETNNYNLKQESIDSHREETGQQQNNNNSLDFYLSSLQSSIEEIKNDKYKIKTRLNDLFNSLRGKLALEKEFLILIFIHFYNTGQLKNPETISNFYDHNDHHDSTLARSVYTYLLSNRTEQNSIIINSILSYIPTTNDYRVIEKNS
jgi:hypothetical protein